MQPLVRVSDPLIQTVSEPLSNVRGSKLLDGVEFLDELIQE